MGINACGDGWGWGQMLVGMVISVCPRVAVYYPPQPFTLCGMCYEYWPKCSNASWLGVKIGWLSPYVVIFSAVIPVWAGF